jgi:hypothetical protein
MVGMTTAARRPLIRPRPLAGLLALAFLLAACGGAGATRTASPSPSAEGAGASPSSASGSPAATAQLPAGWTQVVIDEAGFSIGLPGGWQKLSIEDVNASGAFDAMKNANPEAAGVLQQAQDAIAAGKIALFAFDGEPTDAARTFAANVNVINTGAASGTAREAADGMANVIRQQVPVTGDVQADTVDLPAGAAGVVRYQWKVTGGSGTATDVAVTQYAILAGGTGYIVSFSIAADTADEYNPLIEQMARSFSTD